MSEEPDLAELARRMYAAGTTQLVRAVNPTTYRMLVSRHRSEAARRNYDARKAARIVFTRPGWSVSIALD